MSSAVTAAGRTALSRFADALVFNQHGDKVLEMEGYGMFRRRHPATPEELAQPDDERAGG